MDNAAIASILYHIWAYTHTAVVHEGGGVWRQTDASGNTDTHIIATSAIGLDAVSAVQPAEFVCTLDQPLQPHTHPPCTAVLYRNSQPSRVKLAFHGTTFRVASS